MAIKRVGPQKYQVRINRVDPKTGHKVNRKVTIEGSREDAERAYADLKAEVVSTASRPQRMRLSQYAVSWLSQRELKDTTKRRYAVSLSNILPPLGEYYLDSLTPEIIRDYVNTRSKKAEGYTVLNELRLLRTMAKDAHAARLCPIVFTDRVKAPKVSHYTKADPNRMTSEQFVDTFANLAVEWKPMALLMVTTGLRWGEASALHKTDIKLWKVKQGDTEVEIGEATIRWNNDVGNLVEKHSDTKGIERSVPLVPEVVMLLRPLLTAAKQGPIFVNRFGTIHKSPSTFGRKLWEAEKAAGVPYKVKPHGLRRTWKNIAKHHASREVLKAIGGWSTDEMLEHYDHVESNEKLAAARAVIGTLQQKGKEP